MGKIIGVVLVALFLLIFSVPSTFAAKKFVPKKSSVRYTTSDRMPAVVSYRPDHLGLNLSFSNFSRLASVSYSFTYNTNGIAQGIGGTVTSNNNPTAARELLFGTCSRGACRYHYNLSDARLVLSAKYINGRTATKSYRIKTYQ